MEGYDKEQIAALLKDARAQNKMSVDEVAVALRTYGMEIAPKSIYNYEKGLNMPQVPMFLAMCKVYGIEDPVRTLSAGYQRKIHVSAREETLVEYFRAASPELQDAALRMLTPAEKENTASKVG